MMEGRVDRVEACEMKLVDRSWEYARENAAAIDAHWDVRRRQNPNFFNGPIFVARSGIVGGNRLVAAMMRTDFKSFLYWREHGSPAAGAYDCFGSAILRTADDAVLMCTQRPGNINEGNVYLPGGFIDHRDVAEDGSIDIAASIQREVREETHLTDQEVRAMPGFRVVRCGHQLSIGQDLVSPLPAEALRARILVHLSSDPDPELSDIVIVRSFEDVRRHRVPLYAQLALGAVFGA